MRFGKKTERNERPPHHHRYQVVRTVKQGKKTLRFLECVGSGPCNAPDKMEVK